MAQNYDFQSSGWTAGAPATGAEQVFGLDAGGNLAAMPLAQLRQPGAINRDSSLLPYWRRAKARVRYGSGRARLLCLGDSTTAGGGANTALTSVQAIDAWTGSKAKSWPTVLNRLFNYGGLQSQAESFFGDNGTTQISGSASFSMTNYDPRVVLAGGMAASVNSANSNKPYPPNVQGVQQTLGGVWYGIASGATGSISFTPNTPVDTFIFFYVTGGGNGTLTPSIDGTAQASVNTNTTALGVGSTTVTASAVGTHTLQVASSGGGTVVLGVIAYNSTLPGVDVINAGYAGSTPQVINYTGYPWSALNMIGQVAPDLTIVNLGINDVWNNPSANLPGLPAAMQAIITKCKAYGDVVLNVPNPVQLTAAGGENNYATITTATLATFYAQIYALGVANNIPVVDLAYRFVSGAAMNSVGMMYDQLHPNGLGYADVAQAASEFLLSA